MSRAIRVDWRASLGLVRTVITYLSVAFLIALYYGQDASIFVVSFLITIVIGVALERVAPDPELGAREGLDLMVALTWLFVALIGMIPYLLAGLSAANHRVVWPRTADTVFSYSTSSVPRRLITST